MLEPGDCEPRCNAQLERRIDKQHAGYLWPLLSCLEAIDCPALSQGRGMEACARFARGRLAPSRSLRRFCFEATQRASFCGQKADQSACLQSYRHIEERAIADARACLDKPCAEVPPCFTKAFGM
jgi:hypothetical protein